MSVDSAIGVIVPHDMALDAELWRWTPAQTSLLFTRTAHSPLPMTDQLVQELADVSLISHAAMSLSAVRPQGCVYACTSASFVHGVAGERALVAAMESVLGVPAITTSGALVAALRELGVTRVAAATPYDDSVAAGLTRFLDESGVQVTGIGNLGLQAEIWRVRPEVTADLIRQADNDRAEAIVVCCTNLPSYDVISQLEAELGKPVISANQATMWAALRLVGRAAVGADQALLAGQLGPRVLGRSPVRRSTVAAPGPVAR